MWGLFPVCTEIQVVPFFYSWPWMLRIMYEYLERWWLISRRANSANKFLSPVIMSSFNFHLLSVIYWKIRIITAFLIAWGYSEHEQGKMWYLSICLVNTLSFIFWLALYLVCALRGDIIYSRVDRYTDSCILGGKCNERDMQPCSRTQRTGLSVGAFEKGRWYLRLV